MSEYQSATLKGSDSEPGCEVISIGKFAEEEKEKE